MGCQTAIAGQTVCGLMNGDMSAAITESLDASHRPIPPNTLAIGGHTTRSGSARAISTPEIKNDPAVSGYEVVSRKEVSTIYETSESKVKRKGPKKKSPKRKVATKSAIVESIVVETHVRHVLEVEEEEERNGNLQSDNSSEEPSPVRTTGLTDSDSDGDFGSYEKMNSNTRIVISADERRVKDLHSSIPT